MSELNCLCCFEKKICTIKYDSSGTPHQHVRVDPIGGSDYVLSNEQHCVDAFPEIQLKKV